MTRQLRNLPGSEIGKHTDSQAATLGTQTGNFFSQRNFGIAGDKFQFINLGFQLGNRLFKIQKIHGYSFSTPIFKGATIAENGV